MNVVSLTLHDGRSIEVTLEPQSLVVSVATTHDGSEFAQTSQEFRPSGIGLLDEAMGPIEQSFTEREASPDLGY